jgi:hypothetical protein
MPSAAETVTLTINVTFVGVSYLALLQYQVYMVYMPDAQGLCYSRTCLQWAAPSEDLLLAKEQHDNDQRI